MDEQKDLEIIELRGELEDLKTRYSALELHLANISQNNNSRPDLKSGKKSPESGYVRNLINAAWFPIAAGLIRLSYKFISRVKK